MIAAEIDDLENHPQITLTAMDEEGAKELGKLTEWVLQNGVQGTRAKTCFVTIQLDVTAEPLENFGDPDKNIYKVFISKLD